MTGLSHIRLFTCLVSSFALFALPSQASLLQHIPWLCKQDITSEMNGLVSLTGEYSDLSDAGGLMTVFGKVQNRSMEYQISGLTVRLDGVLEGGGKLRREYYSKFERFVKPGLTEEASFFFGQSGYYKLKSVDVSIVAVEGCSI